MPHPDHDRQARRLDRIDGCDDIRDVTDVFHQQKIDAALLESAALHGELPRQVDRVDRCTTAMGRRHAAGDIGLRTQTVTRVDGNLACKARVLGRLVAEAGEAQFHRVGPEAVGCGDVGARPEIILVDLAHDLWRVAHSGRRPGAELLRGRAMGDPDAAPLQLRSHRAVED